VSAELVEILARALVSRPEEVKVTELKRENYVILSIEVAEEDVGRVIGRQGRIIKAIRKVVRTTGGPKGQSAVVEVVSR
jgi:predicted RNA-binding protein YlqC (UPF0109 family)